MSLVLAQIAAIERAISEDDLIAADSATKTLKPLLLNQSLDNLIEVRDRLSAIQFEVRSIKLSSRAKLKKIAHQRDSVGLYQEVAERRL